MNSLKYPGYIFEIIPNHPTFEKALLKYTRNRDKYILELFRCQLKQLITESGVIIGKVIMVEKNLKTQLIKDGVEEKDVVNILRYLIQKNYLKGYDEVNDLSSVALTSEGFEWVQNLETEEPRKQIKKIFPEEVIKKMPEDIISVCEEFNFVFSNNKKISCMLLLRRLLPLAIVRKFQKLEKEFEIKENNEFISTSKLLEKIKDIFKEKRIYKGIKNYKLLLDLSQHSYDIFPEIEDIEGAAIKLRALLDDLFINQKI